MLFPNLSSMLDVQGQRKITSPTQTHCKHVSFRLERPSSIGKTGGSGMSEKNPKSKRRGRAFCFVKFAEFIGAKSEQKRIAATNSYSGSEFIFYNTEPSCGTNYITMQLAVARPREDISSEHGRSYVLCDIFLQR